MTNDLVWLTQTSKWCRWTRRQSWKPRAPLPPSWWRYSSYCYLLFCRSVVVKLGLSPYGKDMEFGRLRTARWGNVIMRRDTDCVHCRSHSLFHCACSIYTACGSWNYQGCEHFDCGLQGVTPSCLLHGCHFSSEPAASIVRLGNQSWIRRQHITPKRQYIFTRLHVVTFHWIGNLFESIDFLFAVNQPIK